MFVLFIYKLLFFKFRYIRVFFCILVNANVRINHQPEYVLMLKIKYSLRRGCRPHSATRKRRRLGIPHIFQKVCEPSSISWLELIDRNVFILFHRYVIHCLLA